MKLFILTGDPSGDMHASHVVKALWEMAPDTEIAAVGGEALKQARSPQGQAVNLLADQSKMGRVGLGSVMGAPYHIWLGQKILGFLKGFKPDAVLLIDYGGFNLWMAGRLKKDGYRVFYFILPQVWATRRHRIRKIKKHVDHAFCIFPFEEALYQEHGVPVTFVGHPLVTQLPPPADREAFCREHGLDPAQPIVGLFPGSRRMEIEYLLKPMIQSLPLIRQKVPAAQFVLAQAGWLKDDYFHGQYQAALQSLHESRAPRITIIKNKNHAVLSVSDSVLAASGTVTLEAALYKTPMVIIYKLHRLVYEVAMRIRYLPCIGLPNILAGVEDPIAPELLQDDITPGRLADVMTRLLDPNSPEYRKQKEGFDRIEALMNQSSAEKEPAARLVARHLLRLVQGAAAACVSAGGAASDG